MSRGSWYKDPLTGTPEGVDVDQATLRKARGLGCDIFCTRTFAALAGYRSTHYFETEVLTAPGSIFHAVPIYDVDGNTVSWATRTNSGEAGGKAARERANRARGYEEEPCSDVSSGTMATTTLEAVAKDGRRKF